MNNRMFIRLVREEALRLTRSYPRLSMTAATHEAFTRLSAELEREAAGAPYHCLNGHDHDDPWAAQLCNDLVHEARQQAARLTSDPVVLAGSEPSGAK